MSFVVPALVAVGAALGTSGGVAALGLVGTLVSTVVGATTGNKGAKAPDFKQPEAPADPGKEGALAASRETERRRRRLARGRQGTITGAGSGLLNSPTATGGRVGAG